MKNLCKQCGVTNCTKNGKIRSKQRFKCKSCGYNFVLDDCSAKTFKKFYDKLKHLRAIYYTDDWEVYSMILPKDRHILGKKYTVKIEQSNSSIRHYLGRMVRKTKVVSKSEEMVDLSLRICWNINENIGFELYQKKFLAIFS